jgi:hypothetical protein
MPCDQIRWDILINFLKDHAKQPTAHHIQLGPSFKIMISPDRDQNQDIFSFYICMILIFLNPLSDLDSHHVVYQISRQQKQTDNISATADAGQKQQWNWTKLSVVTLRLQWPTDNWGWVLMLENSTLQSPLPTLSHRASLLTPTVIVKILFMEWGMRSGYKKIHN